MFGRLLVQLGFAGLIATCSLVLAFGWRRTGRAEPLGPIVVAALATVLAGAALWPRRAAAERTTLIALLVVSLVVWAIALLVAGLGDKQDDLVRALLFIVYWGAIGAMAARIGARALFGLAFTAIGLRLLILYFEAIGGLTATGLGLIGGGVLCLALTWVGWRLTRRLAHGAIP